MRETGTGPQIHDLIVVRSAGKSPVPTIRRFDVGRGALLSMIAKATAFRFWSRKTSR